MANKGSILGLFPLLSSHDAPTRLSASLSLLTSLPADSNTDEEYAIGRLVKGLSSSNETSRQGFAVALTELLTRLPAEKSTPILAMIISNTTPTAATDSREEREMLFGRLLGLHAIIRAGIIYRPDSTNGESFKEVILALLALAGRKSWMMEPAYWVLIQGVKFLLELEGEAVPGWKHESTSWCIQRLINDSREKARGFGPEKVALVLLLQAYGVEADYVTVLSPTFPSGNPLSRASLVSLSQALKGAIEVEAATPAAKAPKMGSNAVKTAKNNSATPGSAPHFVWSEIFEIYFPEVIGGNRTGLLGAKESRAKWGEVWRVLVDQSLFGPPSHALKSTGFGLLSMAIGRIPAFEVPALFGEGVMRTLSNHLRKSGEVEKTLARVSEKVVASLPPFLALNPSVALPLLKALIAPPHGSHSFDSRTIEKIVAKLDAKGVKGWVKYLKDFIIGEPAKLLEEGETEIELEDEKSVSSKRMWAFDQLLHVAKTTILPKDDETLAGLLEFFAVLGWFEVKKSGKGARSYIPVPGFTEVLQGAARSRFFSVLTTLPILTTGQTWLSRALSLFNNLLADSKHFNLIIEVEEEVSVAQKEIEGMYKKLNGEEDRKKIIRSLVEGVLLLSYDESEQALEVIEQLKDCLSALFPELFPSTNTTKPTADDDMDSEDGEAPEPATVLVNLLLELLHRPSVFIKSISQSVFSGFSNEIGEQAMDLLLDEIRPDEDDLPEAESDNEEADITMADGETSIEPEASTSKFVPKPKKSSNSDSDSSSDSDDSDDENAEVDEDFRNELLAALTAGGVSEAFENAENGEDAEEELLNDDQMMAMDEKLADIFRLQSGGKKGKKAQRTDDLHYRLRVIDLLESLVKQRSINPLLIFVILPLFGIAQKAVTVELELQTKAIKLLRLIVSSKKDSPLLADAQIGLDALTELHSISTSVDDAELASLLNQSAIFLTKSTLATTTNASISTVITSLYLNSFSSYLSKKNSKTRTQPSLTLEFSKRSPVCAWDIFSDIVKMVGEEDKTSTVNSFRRMQGFEVCQVLLASYAATKTEKSKSDILSAMPSYRASILSVLQSPLASTSSTTTLDATRIKDLLKITLAAVRITLSLSTSIQATALWIPSEFSELGEKYKLSERFKGAQGIQNLLNQVVGLINGPIVKDKKRKIVETSEKEQKKSKKGKKEKAIVNEVQVEVEEEIEAIVVEEPAAVVVAEVKKEKKKSKKEKKA